MGTQLRALGERYDNQSSAIHHDAEDTLQWNESEGRSSKGNGDSTQNFQRVVGQSVTCHAARWRGYTAIRREQGVRMNEDEKRHGENVRLNLLFMAKESPRDRFTLGLNPEGESTSVNRSLAIYTRTKNKQKTIAARGISLPKLRPVLWGLCPCRCRKKKEKPPAQPNITPEPWPIK